MDTAVSTVPRVRPRCAPATASRASVRPMVPPLARWSSSVAKPEVARASLGSRPSSSTLAAVASAAACTGSREISPAAAQRVAARARVPAPVNRARGLGALSPIPTRVRTERAASSSAVGSSGRPLRRSAPRPSSQPAPWRVGPMAEVRGGRAAAVPATSRTRDAESSSHQASSGARAASSSSAPAQSPTAAKTPAVSSRKRLVQRPETASVSLTTRSVTSYTTGAGGASEALQSISEEPSAMSALLRVVSAESSVPSGPTSTLAATSSAGGSFSISRTCGISVPTGWSDGSNRSRCLRDPIRVTRVKACAMAARILSAWDR